MLLLLKCLMFPALLSVAAAKHTTSDHVHKRTGDSSKSKKPQQVPRRSNRRRRSSITSARYKAFDTLQARLDHTLALLLEKAALEMPVTSDTAALLRSFRPCTACNKHRRYGEPNDGGYIMCEDDLTPGQIQGAYSYGINGFDGWGNDVSKALKIPVFEYDCTNRKLPLACPSCDLRFRPECILNHKSNYVNHPERATYGTLSQQMQKNGHHEVSEGALLMKIDIEGAEWQIFAEEPAENLKKFREIVVEFHNLDQTDKHDLYLSAVKNILDAGFVVYHIHGNNNAGEARFGTKSVPSVLEVTYLRRPNGHTDSECASHTVTVPEDAVNNAGNPEMQPAQLAL
jgi:hypothetical protein